MPISEDFSQKIRKSPLSRQVIYFFAEEGHPTEEQLGEAFDAAVIPPTATTAHTWLQRLLGGLGIALLLSGIMFFFAYNWADMHKFAKIGLAAGALLITGIFTLRQEAGSFLFQIGLTALTVLTGIQLALLGQIYQSGANAYDFFWAWSILTVFWVASSRFPPLWFFYVVLVNTAIILYAVQVRLIQSEGKLMLVLTIVNGAIAAFWEWHKFNRDDKLFDARWFPRIMLLATCICVGVPAMIAFHEPATFRNISLALFIILNLSIFWFYQKELKDAFMLALPILSGIILVNNLYVKIMSGTFRGDGEIPLFFVWSMLNIGITILAVRYLTKINKQWKQEEIEAQ